jgi:hypothetical protein
LSSRSTPFTSKLSFAVLALAASVATAAGCSAQTASGLADSTPAPPMTDDRGSSGATTLPTVDAGAAQASPYRGNPLCLVSNGDCMPDDDAYHRTTGTAECTEPPPDAGDAGVTGTGTSPSHACRIDRDTKTDEIAATCKDTSNPAGGDGAYCVSGAECAPGFDCVVGGEKNTKACRHYCCAGTCKDHPSQSGGATFCDVQSLVDVNQKAPVCMPLKRCKLLGSGECSTNESCAVVTESGDTGCVATGEQQVGEPCDADHCAENLTCLGKAGARKCFKLCTVSSNDCDGSQICATSTVFKDPNFGICQKP